MRIRLLATLAFLALGSSGCAWCVDQCIGPPARPVRAPAKRPPAVDPCELLPGSMFRASNGDLLWFDVDYAEWRHDGTSEIFDWRCRDSEIQFREGGYASDARLRNERELVWLGVTYVLERRTDTR